MKLLNNHAAALISVLLLIGLTLPVGAAAVQQEANANTEQNAVANNGSVDQEANTDIRQTAHADDTTAGEQPRTEGEQAAEVAANRDVLVSIQQTLQQILAELRELTALLSNDADTAAADQPRHFEDERAAEQQQPRSTDTRTTVHSQKSSSGEESQQEVTVSQETNVDQQSEVIVVGPWEFDNPLADNRTETEQPSEPVANDTDANASAGGSATIDQEANSNIEQNATVSGANASAEQEANSNIGQNATVA